MDLLKKIPFKNSFFCPGYLGNYNFNIGLLYRLYGREICLVFDKLDYNTNNIICLLLQPTCASSGIFST